MKFPQDTLAVVMVAEGNLEVPSFQRAPAHHCHSELSENLGWSSGWVSWARGSLSPLPRPSSPLTPGAANWSNETTQVCDICVYLYLKHPKFTNEFRSNKSSLRVVGGYLEGFGKSYPASCLCRTFWSKSPGEDKAPRVLGKLTSNHFSVRLKKRCWNLMSIFPLPIPNLNAMFLPNSSMSRCWLACWHIDIFMPLLISN